ncbi:MAG: helix-turn-helix domain-containing protein [Planctomycetota bacterium]|jgi:DNA-binding transcriptional MerR regulator
MSPRLPEKLYRIGEVIEHSGLSRQTLHFYATIGLISEKKRTPSGYRLFPPSVFSQIERIKTLKAKGLTLRQIRETLEKPKTTRPSAANATRTTKKRDNTSSYATEDMPDPE